MPYSKRNIVSGILFLVALIVSSLIFSDSSKEIPASSNDVNKEVKGAITPSPSAITPSPTFTGEILATTLYKVVKVVDGDTIDVDINGKVERLRLIGIDTPETVDPREEVECFGIEASNKAKELLEGKSVTLESDETQGEKDKYKRLLRYVHLEDGTHYNLFMIEEGYAHEYTYDNPYKYQEEFKQAQIFAQNNGKGLWAEGVCPTQ